MIFSWPDWSIDHIARHGVVKEEAAEVVRGAVSPYPVWLDGERRLVVGRTAAGRLLNVIYLVKSLDDVEPGSVELFDLPEDIDLSQVNVAFVIHAMPVSEKQRRQDRRRRRR